MADTELCEKPKPPPAKPRCTGPVRRAAEYLAQRNPRVVVEFVGETDTPAPVRKDLAKLSAFLQEWLTFAAAPRPHKPPRIIGHGPGAELAQLQRPAGSAAELVERVLAAPIDEAIEIAKQHNPERADADQLSLLPGQ